MISPLQHDFFALFGLPPRFHLDEATLESAYHNLHAEVHPDRHAHQPETQRRQAMQWATRVNEGYRTLRHPLRRARYLLELAGVDVAAETNTVMAAAFLMEQMQWREEVEDARETHNLKGLLHLHARLKEQAVSMFLLLENQLDLEEDRTAAAETVRRLMFIDRLQQDIDAALETLENE